MFFALLLASLALAMSLRSIVGNFYWWVMLVLITVGTFTLVELAVGADETKWREYALKHVRESSLR